MKERKTFRRSDVLHVLAELFDVRNTTLIAIDRVHAELGLRSRKPPGIRLDPTLSPYQAEEVAALILHLSLSLGATEGGKRIREVCDLPERGGSGVTLVQTLGALLEGLRSESAGHSGFTISDRGEFAMIVTSGPEGRMRMLFGDDHPQKDGKPFGFRTIPDNCLRHLSGLYSSTESSPSRELWHELSIILNRSEVPQNEPDDDYSDPEI
jgi:hypothetical protein